VQATVVASSGKSLVLAKITAWILAVVYALYLAASFAPLIAAYTGHAPALLAERLLDVPLYAHLIAHWPSYLALASAVALALRYKWAAIATFVVFAIFVILATVRVRSLGPDVYESDVYTFSLIVIAHYFAAILALLSCGVALWLWKEKQLR
jgi:hypothetical protein